MLVLSRKKHEKLLLTLSDGRQVVLQILNVDGGRVSLGIDAPLDVHILRAELADEPLLE